MADVDLRSVMNYEALRGIGEISLFREVEDKTYAGSCTAMSARLFYGKKTRVLAISCSLKK